MKINPSTSSGQAPSTRIGPFRARAQHLSEYAILTAVVLSVVIVSQELVKRTLMAKVKDSSDSMVDYSQAVREEFFPEEANAQANAQANNETAPIADIWNEQTVTDSFSQSTINVQNDLSAAYNRETTTQTIKRQEKVQ
jgi:hypothetical protein